MFPQLSENAANSVYWLGWALILVSAVLGLAGSFLGLWGDRERERHDDIRMSANENKTIEANKQAALANERAAELNDRAKQSELRLEQLRIAQGPRAAKLTEGKFKEFLIGKVTGEAIVWFNAEDMEAFEFASAIGSELSIAGWKVRSPIPIPANSPLIDPTLNDSEFLKGMPLQMKSGGTNMRVNILSNNKTFGPEMDTPAGVLTAAFIQCKVGVATVVNKPLPQGQVIIIIGTKP